MILDLSHYSSAPKESNLTSRTLEIPGLKDEILNLMFKLLSDFSFRDEHRKKGYEWLLKTHNLPVVSKKLEEYYKEILS